MTNALERPSVCLNMIVKNEAHIIASTLQNLCDKIYFDYWVIVDTGSTDNTKQIIYNFFENKNIKGELHDTAWKDFGFNRTDALSKAFNKTDYLLVFDADDEIVGDFVLPKELNLDGYHLKFGDNVSYVRLLLVNNKLKWKFVGVLHEYIICTNENYRCKFENIEGNYHIISGKLGARSNNPNKYRDDALILEKAYHEALEKNDDIMVRYSFYCAQSHKDARNPIKSIEWYKKRISHGGWSQEVYYSYITIGHLYEQMNNTESACYYWALSFDADPERCEGIYYIIKHCREKGNHKLAFYYYKWIENNKTRNLINKLFVTEDIYKYLLDYEFTIIACYVGQHKFAISSFHTIFKYAILESNANVNTLSISLKENIVCNLQFYLEFIEYTVENLKFFYDYVAFIKNIYLQKGNVTKHVIDITNKMIEKFTPVLTRCDATNLSFTNLCLKMDDVKHDIILTMTSCKRFDLFQKTMNSFINNCSDINRITYFFCVDDNSSDEDREQMRKNYPFFNFYFKNASEKGHRQSMNIIWNKLNELKPKFYLHLEDDWLFINKRSYVTDSISFLERVESDGIHQLLFNKNYAEVINDFNIIGGKIIDKDKNIKHHIKDEPNLNGSNCAYWPHFSFRPSIIRTSAVLTLGNFDSQNTFFERDYADKYFHSAGYTSAFFNEVNTIHIGKLTSESHPDKKNAYELNNEEQFNFVNCVVNNVNINKEDFPCYLINLDKRQDRFDYCRDKMEIKCERYPAVDGNNLSSYSKFSFLLKYIDNKLIIRGEIGCKFSHYDLWKDIQKPTLIIEDDVMVHEETFTHLKSVFDNLNDLNAQYNWDILYIAGQWTPRYDFNSKPYMDSHKLLDEYKNNVFEHVGSTFYKRNYISDIFNNDLFYTPLYRTTAGYIISPSGANKLCSIINDSPEDFMNEPLDMWLLGLEKNKLINMMDRFPHPMYQGGFYLMKEECLLKTDIDRSKKTIFHLNHDNGNENGKNIHANLMTNEIYIYTNNWFHTSELKRNVHKYLNKQEVNNILEIGCYEGQGSLYFSDEFLSCNGSSLDCVDPFLNEDADFVNDHAELLTNHNVEEHFDHNIQLSKHYDKVHIHKILSNHFFTNNTKTYNFIYIDGSHEIEDIKSDMENAFKILRNNGIMYMDDYLGGNGNEIKGAMDAFIDKYKDEIIVIYKGYQLGLQKINCKYVLDKFEFIEGCDIIGNDLYYNKSEHVIQLLNEALNNHHCVAVNTLGFFKKEIGELRPSHYFSSNDGIYIKKRYSVNLSNNKPIIRVKFIGNFWDTSKKLIEEFKLMIPNNLDMFENIQITDQDSDIDYYVIINMPKDDSTYYNPKKTFVFSMEPDVMKETWGKWRHPNPNDFLYVHNKLNPVQWRFTHVSSCNDINKNDTNKNYNKVACILSHKKYFIGQKKRIDFVNVLEKGECENIIDVFGKENYHNFRSYKGVVPNDNTSNILTQYKYYFMCENNQQVDYATEKIWEPIICECLCFYWGCPNLSNHIDSRAYVALDLNDMEQSKCIVKKAIEEDWWSVRIDIIRAEKQKILTNLGFFPTLKNIIESKKYCIL